MPSPEQRPPQVMIKGEVDVSNLSSSFSVMLSMVDSSRESDPALSACSSPSSSSSSEEEDDAEEEEPPEDEERLSSSLSLLRPSSGDTQTHTHYLTNEFKVKRTEIPWECSYFTIRLLLTLFFFLILLQIKKKSFKFH